MKTLDEILAEMKMRTANGEEPIFNGSDNLNEKNDIVLKLSFTEDAKKEVPEENHEQVIEGNLSVTAVLDKDGKVHAGIFGSMSSPIDSLALIDALQDLIDLLARQGIEFTLNSIKKGR